ncbi:unnamed protein product [Caenorhabditis auriculariae]|uniref:Uncharacterized protein n=1 Tax=Caenorhabditis auriculariae TaxID=2777116 RepID=A0A8S1GQ35_9PELO|nr:unnamed protein product [Caenorhabditis auriculariae]
MPSLQLLGSRLKHLTTQSLFVRGLIPIESNPVLRLLNSLSLQPQQIYFIWSKFAIDSIYLLEELINNNKDTVCDIGLEECAPSHLFTDQLVSPVVSHLTSLRLWNNCKSSHYAITDTTTFALSKAIAEGVPVETIDLATCSITNHSVIAAILAWTMCPRSDLSISLSHCPLIDREALHEELIAQEIFLKEDRVRLNGYTLTLFC